MMKAKKYLSILVSAVEVSFRLLDFSYKSYDLQEVEN